MSTIPPLAIWCNYKVPADVKSILEAGVAGHRLLFAPNLQASNLVASAPDPALAQADIAFGQPDPAALLDLPRLKWIHLTSAGYERYDREDLRAVLRKRAVALTNSSSVYDDPCAQHALAFMLAEARQLPDCTAIQLSDRAWPGLSIRPRCHLLTGQTALFLGFGAIGRRLAELLAPFRMNLMAIRRTPKPGEPIPTHPQSELKKLLPLADHVINILPGGDSTRTIFGKEHFDVMKATAIFYNVGRGSTVDQPALQAALESKKIAAAYLDVTHPEPLPPDHPLWSTPHCHITPHTAGGHADEHHRLVRHFLDNLNRFCTPTTHTDLRDRIL